MEDRGRLLREGQAPVAAKEPAARVKPGRPTRPRPQPSPALRRLRSEFLDLHLGAGSIEDFWDLAEAWAARGKEIVPALLEALGTPEGLVGREQEFMQAAAWMALEKVLGAEEACRMAAAVLDHPLPPALKDRFARAAAWPTLAQYVRSMGDPSILLCLPESRRPSAAQLRELELQWEKDLSPTLRDHPAYAAAKAALRAGRASTGDLAAAHELMELYRRADPAGLTPDQWLPVLSRLGEPEVLGLLHELSRPAAQGSGDRLSLLVRSLAAREGPGSEALATFLDRLSPDHPELASDALAARIAIASRLKPPIPDSTLQRISSVDDNVLQDALGSLPDDIALNTLAQLGKSSPRLLSLFQFDLANRVRQRFVAPPEPALLFAEPSLKEAGKALADAPGTPEGAHLYCVLEASRLYLRTASGERRDALASELGLLRKRLAEIRSDEDPTAARMVEADLLLPLGGKAHQQELSDRIRRASLEEEPFLLNRFLRQSERLGGQSGPSFHQDYLRLSQFHPNENTRLYAVGLAVQSAPGPDAVADILRERVAAGDQAGMLVSWREMPRLYARGRLPMGLLLDHARTVLTRTALDEPQSKVMLDQIEELSSRVRGTPDAKALLDFVSAQKQSYGGDRNRRTVDRIIADLTPR